MRLVLIVAVLLQVSACTSMLLGNNSSSADRSAGSSAGTAAPSAADSAISGQIRQAFSSDKDVSQFAVGIRTIDGTVTLSGTVNSYTVRDRAVEIATNTNGVTAVRNRISVNTNR